MTPQPLQLRDIHLPQPVSWWPPAPGWWLLLGLLLLILLLGVWLRRRYHFATYRRIGLRQLTELEQRHLLHPHNGALATELSRLLRHMAVLHYPDSNCAGLQGRDWLEFLNQPFDDQPFSDAIGQVLMDAPYRRDSRIEEASALIALCRRWLKQLPPVRPRRQP